MFKLPSWLQATSNSNFKLDLDQMDSKSLYKKIIMDIKENVDFNSANLLILNKKEKKLENVAKYGNDCNLIRTMNFKMGHGLSAWLAQKKRYVCLPDIHRGARHMHNPIRSFAAIPIIYNDTVIGVLNLAHIVPNAFGPKQLDVLMKMIESLAPQLNDLISRAIPQGDVSVERQNITH
ncbi:GAF domain-containing protein [candidate division KSB1 bacterium]|nr:GAF domain-containing protein [candidate division KSB1 bacterium]